LSQGPIGVIGGSGLYRIKDVRVKETIDLDTPFGHPSDALVRGEVAGREVVFLPRHGADHTLLPSEIPFCANIYAMKKLGVESIISVSAVGSMKENIHPRDVVFPSQFIDRTRRRRDTFFGNGVVAHIGFAEPTCPVLRSALASAAERCGATVHRRGTYLCIEGPAFSTRAESTLYRSWGVDVIGMTNYQEARLAREAEICYATMACVTDYDCWHETEEAVSVEMLVENLHKNAQLAQRTILEAIPSVPAVRSCACASALKNAILTPADRIPEKTKRALDVIIAKYVK